jgi:hypothetical protein
VDSVAGGPFIYQRNLGLLFEALGTVLGAAIARLGAGDAGAFDDQEARASASGTNCRGAHKSIIGYASSSGAVRPTVEPQREGVNVPPELTRPRPESRVEQWLDAADDNQLRFQRRFLGEVADISFFAPR